MPFLMQNFMLTKVRDRLRYNMFFMEFCSKIRKQRHQNDFPLCNNISNNIILEKEMTITTQFQIFIKYLPIPPTICGLFQEWGYPKTLLSNSI